MIKSIEGNNTPTRIYDLQLLKTLLSIQSKSNSYTKVDGVRAKDQDMLDAINDILNNISLQSTVKLKINTDDYGNIYVTKGVANSYPCIVSHVDTVHNRVLGRRVYQQNDILFAFSDVEKKQVGIGGDDIVGVFTCMQALLDFDILKVVFYRDEEIGHLGSRHSITHNAVFYKNCNFILQCDRRGNSDFLTTSAATKLCSDDFIGAAKPFVEKHGYVVRDNGVSTDVDTLVRGGVGVSCVNLSSGYFNPHTDNETVSVNDVGRAYSLMYDIVYNLQGEKFPFKYTPTAYSYGNTRKQNSNNTSLSLFNNYPVTKPVTRLMANNKSKFEELPGMYNIVTPTIIKTDLTCPKCKQTVWINTTENELKCYSCKEDVNTTFMDWHTDTVVTFTGEKDKKEYVYSWYYDAWVEKLNSVFVTENNLNFWISKEMYEKEWKT